MSFFDTAPVEILALIDDYKEQLDEWDLFREIMWDSWRACQLEDGNMSAVAYNLFVCDQIRHASKRIHADTVQDDRFTSEWSIHHYDALIQFCSKRVKIQNEHCFSMVLEHYPVKAQVQALWDQPWVGDRLRYGLTAVAFVNAVLEDAGIWMTIFTEFNNAYIARRYTRVLAAVMVPQARLRIITTLQSPGEP